MMGAPKATSATKFLTEQQWQQQQGGWTDHCKDEHEAHTGTI